jgi:hypothetical protein
MTDPTEQEQATLLQGYAQQLQTEMEKMHGAEDAAAIFNAVGRAGGFTQQELMQAARTVPASKLASALTDGVMRGKIRDDTPDNWSTPGKAQLDDETWSRIRAKQRRKK